MTNEAIGNNRYGVRMNSVRKTKKIWKGKPTIEGAGVHLKRAFGNSQVPQFDPFLMLDDFHSSNPADYLPGFLGGDAKGNP